MDERLPETDRQPLLALNRVSRRYGGVRAVDGVSLDVMPGVIHGLIGPNGAGKTTVINMVSGLAPPSDGQIVFGGVRIDRLPAHRIAALGIRRTFQNIRLFPTMTAIDNVVAGRHGARHGTSAAFVAMLPGARRENRDQRERAAELLARVGLGGRAERQARHLPYGDQRRLEIARALAGEPRLLLLDEPAAGMPHGEMMALAPLIRSIAASGVAVLLVEHHMELVMDVCDRITVLDFGHVIAEGTPAQIVAHEAVISAYLGTDL